MKRPIKGLAILILLCVLVACNKRVVLDETSSAESLKEVLITTHFTSQASGLRSDISERAQYIAKDIRRISFNDIRIIFYSMNEAEVPQSVLHLFDKKVSCDKGVLQGTEGIISKTNNGAFALTLKNLKVPAGNYKVLIVCNPTDEFKERTAIGENFSALRSDFVKQPFDKNSRLLMQFYTNADQLIKITKENFDQTKGSQPLEIKAELKPNFAYASIFWDNIKIPTNHRIETQQIIFLRDVSNKKFRLFPEYQEIDLDNGLKGHYPVDANFNGYQDKSWEDLKEDFDYIKDYRDTGIYQKIVTRDVEEKFQGFIIPENTVDGSDLNAKNVTRLIVGITYSPDQDIPLGEDWLTIRGKHYSKVAFETLIRKIKQKKSQEQSSEEKELLKIYTTLKPHFDRVTGSNIFGYSSDDVQFYKKGVTYYAIPIRHFKDNELSTKKKTGRYGVVRNTLYMIHIASLSQIGFGDPLTIPHDTAYDTEGVSDSSLSITPPDIVEYTVDL
ncbi:fimbria major subunit [Porphyromonas cangingivalis]|uniref:fimbria major subunit n=1 Tax=Porphyromonas cangingivalis TaxID=36874 RepID=UPI00242FEBF3|nr:fimbria major subunit [Porphyromonas cangingivalis]